MSITCRLWLLGCLNPQVIDQVRHDQIARLIHLLETTDHIKVQLLPLEVGLHPGTAGSFTILDFANALDPSTTYTETRTDGLYLERTSSRCIGTPGTTSG